MFYYHINFHAKIINQMEKKGRNVNITFVSLSIYVFSNLFIEYIRNLQILLNNINIFLFCDTHPHDFLDHFYHKIDHI